LNDCSPSKLLGERSRMHTAATRQGRPKVTLIEAVLASDMPAERDVSFALIATGGTLAIKDVLKYAVTAPSVVNGVPVPKIAGGLASRFISKLNLAAFNRSDSAVGGPALEEFKKCIPQEVSKLCSSA
jgi:hypothetical protein